MKRLSRDAYARARAFVAAHARPLEQAIFACEFEDGDVNAVWEALAGFRNTDGGFGHALEPDFRLPDSSVLATTVGLQVLREYGATDAHPLVRGAMSYLMATYEAPHEVWPIIPPTADDAPHAPWWGYSEDVADNWGGFLVNPRAEIAGYLHDYADLVPEDLRTRITAVLLQYLKDHADEIGMMDVLCYERFAETVALPKDVRDELIARLSPVVDRLVVKTPTEWEKYVLTPLELVDRPASPFASLFPDVLAQNLDFKLAHQSESGAWEPKWTWGDSYPDVWPQARQDWSGVLTVRTLKILKRFGRLEG